LFGFQGTVNWFCKVLWESLEEIFQGIAERYELEIALCVNMSEAPAPRKITVEGGRERGQ